jgi:hypothetical protein
MDTKAIRAKALGEEHPGDVWFVETVEALCDEVEKWVADRDNRQERDEFFYQAGFKAGTKE